MNVNLNLYRYFYEVAKYESYTKAAEVNMVSQPSLSYSVKTLENQIGKQLFKKVNGKIRLTEYGKELYEKLNIIFSELSSIVDKDEPIEGLLKIGARSAYATRILPLYISEIINIYPKLKIEIYIAKTNELLKMLESNDVDLIIDEYEYKDKFYSVMNNQLLHPILFTNNAGYEIFRKKYKSEINLDKIENEKIYIVGNNKIGMKMKDKFTNIQFENVQSTAIMVDLIKKNNGLGVSQRELIDNELKHNVLKEINCINELPLSSIYFTYIRNLRNKRIELFINFICNHSFYEFNND